MAEIPGVVEDYRKAAGRVQNGSDKRTDAYGGPIENRARFLA